MKPLNPIYTGTVHTFPFVYKDVDGVAIDVTGYTADMVIRSSHHKPPLYSGTAIIGGTDGKITFELDRIATAALLSDGRDSEKLLIGATVTKPGKDPITLLQTTIDVKRNIVS